MLTFKVKSKCPYCGLEGEFPAEVVRRFMGGVSCDTSMLDISISCPRCLADHKEKLRYDSIDEYDSSREAILRLFNEHILKAPKVNEGFPVPCTKVRPESVEMQIEKLKSEVLEAEAAIRAGNISGALEELADVQIAATTAQNMLGADFHVRRTVMQQANLKNLRRGYWLGDYSAKF